MVAKLPHLDQLAWLAYWAPCCVLVCDHGGRISQLKRGFLDPSKGLQNGSTKLCCAQHASLFHTCPCVCLTPQPSVAYMRQWTGHSISSGTGLLPVRCQPKTWTNADLLSLGPLWTNLGDILIKIQIFFIHENVWNCSLRNGDIFV